MNTRLRLMVLNECRNAAKWIQTLIFYTLIQLMFVIALASDASHLHAIVPAMFWLPVLLSTLLTLPRLFMPLFHTGVLEQWVHRKDTSAMLLHVFVHWLFIALPLLCVAPLLMIWFSITLNVVVVWSVSVLLGSISLMLTAAVIAALTIRVRSAGVLLSILLLPLWVPVLIFGVSAVHCAQAGLPAGANIALLGAFALFSLSLTPMGIRAALHVSLS